MAGVEVDMKRISMVELRQRADAVLKSVAQGQSFELTYRGKLVARLEPVVAPELTADDKFYKLADYASDTGESLTNQQIDEILYGE
jgi:antitoxin (DNA-binding transcriptional repressor) of toxin-antitoxin stability system